MSYHHRSNYPMPKLGVLIGAIILVLIICGSIGYWYFFLSSPTTISNHCPSTNQSQTYTLVAGCAIAQYNGVTLQSGGSQSFPVYDSSNKMSIQLTTLSSSCSANLSQLLITVTGGNQNYSGSATSGIAANSYYPPITTSGPYTVTITSNASCNVSFNLSIWAGYV